MSIVLNHPKTEADYAQLPEGAPIQLIAGEFIMSPSPLVIHQRISRHLANLLDNFVLAHGLGEILSAPMDVHLSDHDVYQPDILFVTNENQNMIRSNAVYGAPDLVIEILSPSTAHYDLHEKKEMYEKCGVKEYWIVDPEARSVEIFENRSGKFETRFSGKEGTINSIVLPEFSIAAQDVFARL